MDKVVGFAHHFKMGVFKSNNYKDFWPAAGEKKKERTFSEKQYFFKPPEAKKKWN